ncbi:MAG: BMP family ABC transporter substrate-binding protein [Clostridia bacterium]|nr:BMP family ABC transporter substrate-binding protein [Clostridia bacterium]
MKKFLALFLTLALCLSAVSALAEAVNAADIEDTVASADGTYVVAFVTDVGQLKDKSFNEGTWNGAKTYAYENGLTYKYYQPANGDQATDDDRYDAMKAAAEAGAKVIVCAGFMQGTALEKAAKEFTDVKFIFIDGWALGLDNVIGVAFKEEQCGYLAGYAAVMDGYTKLGFSGGGGGTNPACMRYGYGYIQGANDAAAKLGIQVEIKFTWAYGASFSPSAELQTLISGWYETGTEVVFSCGGSIFSSITAAASANDGAVIGVDVDQSYESDTVITSALKGITEGTYQMLAKVFDGTWEGGAVSLGAAENAVGLPVETWSLEGFSVEDYEAMKAAIVAGEIVIDDAAAENDPNAKGPWSNVTVDYIQ